MQKLIPFIYKKHSYYWILILTAICLPLSKFALSITMILLLANWILEWDWKSKWNRIKFYKPLWVFTLLFGIHLIWLVNTENTSYAYKDIGNKVILLLYPLVIGSSDKISSKQLKNILVWFSVAVIVSSFISAGILFEFTSYRVDSLRDISPFMSHIRLSLLVNMAIFSLAYILFSKQFYSSKTENVLVGSGIVWLIVFLFLLKSFTGILIFIIVSLILSSLVSAKIKELVPRLFVQVFIITIVLLIASYSTHTISRFYTIQKIDLSLLDEFTVNGNKYEHHTYNKQIENGNYTGLYVCKEELEKEWNKRSELDYYGKDYKGQDVRITLIRYLTSKGLRKDSLGISKLSDRDIKNIESGLANYIYENKYAIYPKIYQIIWELDVYKKGGNPTGNSVTQRIEYLKTAKGIINDNFWFGVGTGDVKNAFDKQYEINNSRLPENKRLRAHNQYITFLLTFGIFGFIVFIVSIFYPVIKLDTYKNYLFLAFLLIALLSFMNEDTLETQIGVTFFSYFYSLFLFGNNLMIKKE